MEIKIETVGENIEVTCKKNDKYSKATCFFQDKLEFEGKKVGSIGDLETEDFETGVSALKRCEEILKEKGCRIIVAPMNGNTWKKYRVLKWTNGEPPFVLENVNKMEDNEILKAAGFEELYTYTSTKGKIEDYVESKAFDRLEEKMNKENIIIRKFRKDHYIEDLKKIYNVTVPSFYRNPFYIPMKEEDFLAQYEKYIPMFDEDFILIAEKEEKEIGFLFALPNGNSKTLVVKTVAVLEQYQKYAVGNVMFRKIYHNAKKKGYKNWIFAFMFENNTSQKSARRHNTELIREYALYVKRVEE